MLLVIETATAALSVALFEDDRILAHHHEIVGRGHAERLLPIIADLLGSRRPDGVAVDCGPGSFTGIRVGLAASQGFRIAWGVPAHGFSSTALIAAGLLAAGVDDVSQGCAVALLGGHGEVFVEMFDQAPIRSPMRSLTPSLAAQVIPHARIHGSGASLVVAARGWGEAVDVLPDARNFERLPSSLARLPLRPLYGRAPDAKVPEVNPAHASR